MIIELKNCSSIDYGKIEVTENTLNIFYAINGTGKTTVAKAITARNDPTALEKLRPFKYLNSVDELHKPNVSGLDATANVIIFDERFVSQFVFKSEELIQNSFEIFIKTPDYERQLQVIDESIKETKEAFASNPELDDLISDFTTFIDGFGRAQSGYSAAGAIGKGLGSGNKVHNIPDGLTPYKMYIENSTNGANAKWVKWHLNGNEFFSAAHQCPYCAKDTNDETKGTILKVSEEYNSKDIEHLNKMLEVFDKLGKYFSNATSQKIDEITKNISGISSEQRAFLLEVKSQANTLKDKLWKIKTMSFITLKDVNRIVNEISSLKIDLTYLYHLNSDYSQVKIGVINAVLDNILTKATELQAAIGKQNTTIKKTISEYSIEINSFLKYAGYEYTVSLSDDNEQGLHKLLLKHCDMTGVVNEVDSHLSFGERNAFALVLFMYQTLKSSPDLIILDDPISSFDGNKKYAVLYRLFKEKRSFKDNTVILLTHEFSTVIDTIYNMPSTIKARAIHLENNRGRLIGKAISKEKIKSFNMIAKENVLSATQRVSKLIYLRRLLEVDDQKGMAWQLLSNLFKDNRNKPLFKSADELEREMTNDEIMDATRFICNYIPDFNYDEDYRQIQDKNAIALLYISSRSNYEKLQFYRIINNSNNSNNVIKKYINETFHIENDYLFQLNPLEYEMVPQYVVRACDDDIRQMYPNMFISRIANSGDNGITDVLDGKQIGRRRPIPLYELPASAGTGHWIDDTEHENILVDDIVCDYAAYISGDSMMPKIQDKSIVLVKFDPNITDGDIGIFCLNGSIYCKQLSRDGLVSLNEEYSIIEVGEYDDLRMQGKVVKIILPSSVDTEVTFV